MPIIAVERGRWEAETIRTLEALAIEAILQMSLIEQRLRATLMPNEGTTQENPVWIFQDRQRALL
jgi:hypothetical protein